MITERSIRADMAVEAHWESKIDQYIGDREFEEAHPW